MIRTPLLQNLQRVGFLASLPGILQNLDVDPGAVLRAVGLGDNALNDPDSTIPYEKMGLLMQVAAAKTRCSHLGLEVGRNITLSTLGLLGEQMRNAPTLRVALRDFSTNQYRNSQGSVVYLLEEGDHAFFGYAVYQPKMHGAEVICDGAALGILTVINELLGRSRRPVLQVLLSRSEPLDLKHYRACFGGNLHFNAEQTAVRLPRRWLEEPVAGANALLREALDRRAGELWGFEGLDTVTQLRRHLRVALLTGQSSAVDICSHLGIDRRTFERRLEDWGVHFSGGSGRGTM